MDPKPNSKKIEPTRRMSKVETRQMLREASKLQPNKNRWAFFQKKAREEREDKNKQQTTE